MNAWMNMACFLLSDITGLIRTLKIQKGTKKCFVLPLSPPELNLLNWSILCEDPNFPGSWLSLPLYISGTCWFYFKVDTGAGLCWCPVHPLLPGFPLLQRWKRNWIPRLPQSYTGPSDTNSVSPMEGFPEKQRVLSSLLLLPSKTQTQCLEVQQSSCDPKTGKMEEKGVWDVDAQPRTASLQTSCYESFSCWNHRGSFGYSWTPFLLRLLLQSVN